METYRTAFSRVIAVLVAAVCAIGLVMTAVADLSATARGGWPFVVVGAGAWALFWRPYVELNDAEAVLVNVFRTIRVPWVRVTAIDSRWSFTVHTDERRYSAWAVPGASGMGTRARMMRNRGAAGESNTDGNNAAAVALAAAERMQQLRDAGHLGAPRSDIPVTTTWNVPVLAVAAVVAVFTAAGVLL